MSHISEYRRDTARVIRETRQAIQKLRVLIAAQQDNPAALIAALLEIDKRLDDVETETTIINENLEEMGIVTSRLRKQRDSAYHDKKLMLRLVQQYQDELNQRRQQPPK